MQVQTRRILFLECRILYLYINQYGCTEAFSLRIIRNPELRGIIGLILSALFIAVIMLALTGKLTEWFGIRLTLKKPLTNAVVFVSDRGGNPDIWFVREDGSESRQLTNNSAIESNPVVSPDGYQIAFLARKGEEHEQVWTMYPDGTGSHRLTDVTGTKSSLRYTPDGKKLLFVSAGSVWEVSATGGAPKRLLPTHEQTLGATVAGEQAPFEWAAYSSDGKTLAAVQDFEQGQILVKLAPGDDMPTQVVHHTEQGDIPLMGEMVSAAWVPGSSRLAVAMVYPNGSGGLVMVDIDADTAVPIIGGAVGNPDCSRDGSIVVTMLKRVGVGEYKSLGLMVVNPYSASARTFKLAGAENPVWSMDGKKVAFSRGGDIYLLDPETGKTINLTSGRGISSQPAFAPTVRK